MAIYPRTLLTGSTGLVGRFVLAELLSQGSPTVLLVRRNARGTVEKRIEEILGQFELPADYPHPVVLEADLSQAGLGLSNESIDWLASAPLNIIHSAASIRFHAESKEGEPYLSNVNGTANLLDLCQRLQVAKFNHVSTAYVQRLGGVHFANPDKHLLERFVADTSLAGNDYEHSKILAEKLVRECEWIDNKSFFRPSIVIGDFHSGYSSTFHGYYAPLQIGAQLAKVNGFDEHAGQLFRKAIGLNADDTKNFVPVDWVARCIAKLSNDPRTLGKVFHLTNPDPVSVIDIQSAIVDALEVRFPRASSSIKANLSQPSDDIGASIFQEQMKVYGSYFQNDPKFDCSNTLALLPTDRCPKIDYAVLRRMADFALNCNFGWQPRKTSNANQKIRLNKRIEDRHEHAKAKLMLEDEKQRLLKPLAIVGMECRLPGGDNLEAFWELLQSGTNAITKMPESKLDRKRYYHPSKGSRGKTYSDIGGMIDERDLDWSIMPIEKSKSEQWDESHLILCEVVASALQRAGYDPKNVPTRKTGVYVGHSGGTNLGGEIAYRTLLEDYVRLLADVDAWKQIPPAEQTAIQTDLLLRLRSNRPVRNEIGGPCVEAGYAAGLISKAFQFTGPHMTVDAACASSLVSLALAASALQSGQIQMAIVGGASYNKCDSLILFSQAQSCSASGSRPFDASADGLVSAEGYVALVIKTLEQAIEDGDEIQAVIQGIGLSSDGRGRSLWAPRKEGQRTAIERAYHGEITPESVQLVEAHATSTQVGDATEMEALSGFFHEHVPEGTKIPVGSVKSNIGHSLETAGLAGLVKSVLAMQHECIPPSINVTEFNNSIHWDAIPLFVPKQSMPWLKPSNRLPRRAAVNAFGIGGLNVHIVVDQFEPSVHLQSFAKSRKATLAGSSPNPMQSPEPIAVIGRGVIVPGSLSIERFANFLSQPSLQLTNPPIGRWPAGKIVQSRGNSQSIMGGFINDFEYDWRKHKVPPKQIAQANPLQFMLLEAAEQAFREANYLDREFDRKNTAVVVGAVFGGDFGNALYAGLRLPELREHLTQLLSARGVSSKIISSLIDDYENRFLKSFPALLDETGSFTSSTLASRLSKTFDLMGGAMAIDSGEVSSLAALDAAINLLRSNAVTHVLCATAQRSMDRAAFERYLLQSIERSPASLSTSRTSQLLPAEGVGMLLLKRLSDATRDGDNVIAVIDELKTTVRETTGTQQLHPLPKHASVTQKFVGDLMGSQGMIDLIEHSLLPVAERPPKVTSVHSTTGLQYEVVFQSNDAQLDESAVPANKSIDTSPLINTASPPAFQMTTENRLQPFVVRLEAGNLQELISIVRSTSLMPLEDVKRTSLDAFRSNHWRVVAIVTSDDYSKKLSKFADQIGNANSIRLLADQSIFWAAPIEQRRKIAWFFPGQGSQYANMLMGFASANPAAKQAIERADRQLAIMGEPRFADLVATDSNQLGTNVWHTQSALLVADYAMLSALKSEGLSPDMVGGHSFGEFAAMLAAGCWDIETALVATWRRCQSIQDFAPNGCSMLSIGANQSIVSRLLESHRLAAVISHNNSENQTVVGGKQDAIYELIRLLQAVNIPYQPLAVPTAFHTPFLLPVQDAFRSALEDISIEPPQIPLLSSVNNRYVADPEWIKEGLVNQLVTPIRFTEMVNRLVQDGVATVVEVGPQQVLTKLIRQTAGSKVVSISTDSPNGIEHSIAVVKAVAELFASDDVKRRMQVASRTTIELVSKKSTPVSGLRVAFDATSLRREKMRNTAARSAVGPGSNGNGSQIHQASIKPNGHSAHIASSAASISKASSKPTVASPSASTVESLKADKFEAGPATPAIDAASKRKVIETFLIDFVVEQTGYPSEMIELEWDIEADLGIDSIKKAQLFGELREFFDLESHRQFSLNKFKSLQDIVNLLENTPGKAEWLAMQSELQSGSAHQLTNVPRPIELTTGYQLKDYEIESPDADSACCGNSIAHQQETSSGRLEESANGKEANAILDLKQFLIDFVVEQTGYPAEIVELDADLEADLGIDSIKKAQLFGELREIVSFDVPSKQGNPFALSQFKTLRSVLEFLQPGSSDANVSLAPSPGSHIALEKKTASLEPAEASSRATETIEQTQYEPLETTPDEPSITHRFVLRMIDSPLLNAPHRKPTWSGSALVVGDNPVAKELELRIAASGVGVTRLAGTTDEYELANELDRLWAIEPVRHLFITTPCDPDAVASLDESSWNSRKQRGLMSIFWLCQRWFKHMCESGWMDDASLVAVSSMGGDFGAGGEIRSAEGGGLAGLLKAMLIEAWVQGFRAVPIKVIDTSSRQSATTIVDGIWNELAVPTFDVEVSYASGQRKTFQAVKEATRRRPHPITRQGTWVCTGGARGITAYVAQALAQRYQLTLHLIGTMPLDDDDELGWQELSNSQTRELRAQVMTEARNRGDNPVTAWQDKEKVLEIKRNLTEFASHGIEVHYHQCDVSNRHDLDKTLRNIRRISGPITGVLHGAGIGKDARFDRKQPEKVKQCIAAKVDGSLALMQATLNDPLEVFIGFGSISGRFGANGHTDYSLSNDMLCKQIRWFQSQRPSVRSIGFHWHAWGDVGMATKPETKLALEMIKMQFMPAREGLNHLIREIENWSNDSEILITDDRYYRLFYASELLGEVTNSKLGQSTYKTPLINESTKSDFSKMVHKATLDPKVDPFLTEHRLDDAPLLPIVIGTELLLESARAHLGHNRKLMIQDVKAVQGLRFFSEQSQTVRIVTSIGTDKSVECNLLSDFHARDGRLIQANRLNLTGSVMEEDRSQMDRVRIEYSQDAQWQRPVYPTEQSKFYVGLSLQRLRGFTITEKGLVGRIIAPALIELAGGSRPVDGWQLPSSALDACLFATGILAWQKIAPGSALPTRFGKISIGRLPIPGEACEVHVRIESAQDDRAQFHFTLYGVDGSIIVNVANYEVAWLKEDASLQSKKPYQRV